MTKLSVILAVLVAAPAAAAADDEADAADAAEPCGVHLERAPAELAASIEARLEALSACGGRLDVYIVQTPDGLYVNARDPLGRVRERIVPDAEVAAALIASWVETDAAVPLTGAGLVPPPLAPMPELPPAKAPPLADVGERVVPPAVEPVRPSERTVGLTVFAGFTTGGMTTGGAVIDHDVWHHDGLTVAVMAVLTRDVSSSYYVVRWDDDFFKETGRWGGAGLVELRHRFGTGRWRFTPSVAFGIGATRHEVLTADDVIAGDVAMPVMKSEGTFGPRIAATVAIGFHVAASLDLEVGGGWMFSGYQVSSGVAPSDQSIVGGIGLRHDR